MKRISFQWRITLMTAFLIALSCIVLNLLLYYSGTYYLDLLADYAVEYGGGEKYTYFSDTLTETKSDFAANGWMITVAVTLVSSVIAYFVSGMNLKPIRLSDAFETQKRFVGNAAHELRTPLALMQARIDLCQRNPQEEAEETIAFLADQTGRLSDLVKTLLAMSDLETVPRQEAIDLMPLIEEVLTDLAPLADRHAVSLIQEGENISARGSDILFYRMLYNLVENGIKYNIPHGCVSVSAASGNKDILIRVSDTGKGIPKEHRKSVFQPFYRIDKSRSSEPDGVGLGLSLVWEVVRLHGGTVQIEDNTPGGTVFAVRLPIEI